MESAVGRAKTDDNWVVECPVCNDEIEYEGFFDPEDKNKCNKCGCEFVTKRIEFADGSYIIGG